MMKTTMTATMKAGHRCNPTRIATTTPTTRGRLPLTISHQLGWIKWLGGYLSCVLSVHFGGGDAAPPHPLGQHWHWHCCMNIAIAIIIIPKAMTPGRMPASQPNIIYMHLTFKKGKVTNSQRLNYPLTEKVL